MSEGERKKPETATTLTAKKIKIRIKMGKAAAHRKVSDIVNRIVEIGDLKRETECSMLNR